MAFTIRVKRGTSNPTTQLLEGELGYNTSTDKLFIGNGTGVSATGVSMDGHTHPFTDITGTATTTQIPNLDASKITTGTFTTTQIPNIDTSKITTGTLGVARGGTGVTSITAGNLLVGNGTSAITSVTPDDATTYTVLSSSGVAPILERSVYFGTHFNQIGISSAIASSTTYTTMTFTSGMRNFILQIHQDTTTGSIIARLPLTITGSDHYSLDTTSRTHRIAWSNGTVTQVTNVDVYYSGTTLYFRHNFTGTSLAFRWFGY